MPFSVQGQPSLYSRAAAESWALAEAPPLWTPDREAPGWVTESLETREGYRGEKGKKKIDEVRKMGRLQGFPRRYLNRAT